MFLIYMKKNCAGEKNLPGYGLGYVGMPIAIEFAKRGVSCWL